MRFPHYHQLEARDCGPTCLRMIARHYGKSYGMTELKLNCAVTRAGVSLQDVMDGAGKIGLETLPVKIEVGKLKEIPLPAILFWRQEHYVVLYKIGTGRSGKEYFLSDPAFGRVRLSHEVFTSQWLGNEEQGVALLVEPGPGFADIQPQREPRTSILRELGRLLGGIARNNQRKSIAAFLMIVVAMVATWLFPGIFQKMIDQGVLGRDMHIVIALLITQIVIYISQLVSDSLSTVLLMQVNFKVSVQFLVNYLFKLIRLPLKVFDARINSDLLLRMDDSDRIQSFLTHHSLELILSFVNLTIFSALLGLYSPWALAIFAGLSCCSVTWTLLFLSRRKLLDYSRFSVSSETRNSIYELINEMPEIKINNAHRTKVAQWERKQQKLNAINLKALYLNYYQLVGAGFFNRIKGIIITAYCAWLVIGSHMTLGVMMTIGYILGQLNTPIDNLINIILGLQDARLSFDRLRDIQRLTDEDVDKPIQLGSPPDDAITLRNISFKYEGSFNPTVLHGIDLTIPVGKITAIVGASGSGKTTLLKLLLAIYEPSSGEIYLDRLRLKDLQPDSWRNRCAVVLQNGYLFSGTYAENIALSDEVPDMDKVRAAARLACMDDFIANLPLGYNTQIGKTGNDISGGQKQRILIARAIYRNPAFIFLDEATSSLDSTNEKKIMDNMHEFFQGRTVVIIAHRLSTVRNADQIVVLEKGRIVEKGGHDELVRSKDKYFHLVRNQLELGA